jgi:hypothetical protein
MTTVPDREELRALYDEAVLEVDATRGSLTNDFYAKTGDAVFDGGYLAITDACGGTNARIHTIAAPVGAGKTSFSYALMVAFTRYAETHPDAPIGCAFLCDQIEKADLAFRELDALMPGKVAIWTTDHDKRGPKGEKVKNPAAVFMQEDLRDYPVIVVTHKFFNDRNGPKARYIVNGKGLETRSLFIVDERPEEVSIYDTTLTEAQAVKEALTTRHPETAGPLENLLLFIMQYTLAHDGNTIIHPINDYSPQFIAEQLKWFRSEAAERIRKANAARDEGERIAGLDQLFGFAYALSVGCGFIVPSGQIVRFVGWKSKLMAHPGMMLLDATADVDGVSLLCPWREPVPVP